ncbi:hypothetical protein [Undibacterium squillarum]|uniref:hypothetical protein n=1 Tax=Undibacterium squillarum TaxID=1131567 RepID=UPI0035AEB522
MSNREGKAGFYLLAGLLYPFNSVYPFDRKQKNGIFSDQSVSSNQPFCSEDSFAVVIVYGWRLQF